MDERTLKWLYDIKIAIAEIDEFFDGKFPSFGDYKSNLLLRRGVERNLEIIGEAMNRIRQRSPESLSEVSEAHAIIALRNHIIHSYDNVSDESIWSILKDHLPVLKTEIDGLIGDL